MSRDLRIDAYIASAQPFARPILQHVRDVIHAACPDVVETIKWSSPFFLYKGEMLCNMAAFKAHAAFGFWKGALVTEDTPALVTGMGQFGRIRGIGDLPPRADMAALIRKAMALTDAGVKTARSTKHPKPPVVLPEDLAIALAASPPPGQSMTRFLRASGANMSIGSSAPNDPRPARAGLRRRLNGWRMGSAATGNMKIADWLRTLL